MGTYFNVNVQQQMQCRQRMCQQRCRQMLISNCIKVDKLTESEPVVEFIDK